MADGSKYSIFDRDGNETCYCGSFVCAKECDEYIGEFSVASDEGRVSVSRLGEVQDRWFVRDHLGNVRTVVDLTRSATMPADSVILEQDDYLPYGTKSSTSSLSAGSAFRYRYAGKEEQRFGAFDSQLLDFGARYYDPWSCQWTAVDPMAEKYVGSSPTSYCALNPVNIVDLNGMDWYQCDSTGYYTWFDGSDDREGYTYIGGKGALFGEYELFVEDSYFRLSGKNNSLYTNESTIEFASNEKTGEDILLEFYNNSGPLITVFGPNCRLTKLIANWSMMTDYINEYQGLVLNGSSDIPGQYTNAKIPGGYRQITEAGQYDIWNFIGSANYDGIIDSSTNSILNIVGDCKSKRSLFYHLAKDKSRKECAHLGNNYQLYIWFSSK